MEIRIVLFLSILLLFMNVTLNNANNIVKNSKFGLFGRFSLFRSIFGKNKYNNNKKNNKRTFESRKFHFMRLYDSIKNLLNRNRKNNNNFVINSEIMIHNLDNHIEYDDNVIVMDDIIENLETLRSSTIENIDTLVCENCEDSNQVMLGRKEKPSSLFDFIDFNILFLQRNDNNHNNNDEPRRITDGREYDFTYFYTLLLLGMVGWYATSKDHEAIRQRQQANLNEAVTQSLQAKGIYINSAIEEIDDEIERDLEVIEGVAVVQESDNEIESNKQNSISEPSSPSPSSSRPIASSNITPVVVKTEIKVETPVQQKQEHQVESKVEITAIERVKEQKALRSNSPLVEEIKLVLEQVPQESPLPPLVRPLPDSQTLTDSTTLSGSPRSTIQTLTNTNTQTIPMTLCPTLRSPSPRSSGSTLNVITTPSSTNSSKSIDDANDSLDEISMMNSPIGMGIGGPYDGLSSDSSSVQSPEGESLSAYKRKLEGMAGALAETMDMRGERDQSRDFDLDDLESMLLNGTTSSYSASKNQNLRRSSESQSPYTKLGGDGRVYNSLGNASYKDGHYEHALQYYEMARAILSEGEGDDKQVDQKLMDCISTNIDLSMKKILEKACDSSPPKISYEGEETLNTASMMDNVSATADVAIIKPSPRRVSPDSIIGMWT